MELICVKTLATGVPNSSVQSEESKAIPQPPLYSQLHSNYLTLCVCVPVCECVCVCVCVCSLDSNPAK